MKRRHIEYMLYALTFILFALLAAWYIRSYGWNDSTLQTLGRLRESTATSERRADAIVDATRQREVTARETARKKTADLPADRLAAALEQMLAEYRAGR